MSVNDIFDDRPDYPRKNADDQAAYWMTMLGSDRCTPAQRRSFALWLDDHQENRDAFDQLAAVVDGAELVADDPMIRAIRREALGQGLPKPFWVRHRGGLSVAAMGIAATVVVAFSQWGQFPFGATSDSATYSAAADEGLNTVLLTTNIGEQLTRQLADGSTLEVNTDSEIRVELSDNQRSIYLLRGQAMFDVAHDESRPFVVFAGDRRVTALGTLFEVRMDSASTQVTLLEGKVRVEEIALTDVVTAVKPVASVELKPGERFVSADGAMSTVPANVIESDLSWRQGRHIFVDAKLSDIVAEMNRYTTRTIKLMDPTIGELETSANFKLGSTLSLAAALEANFGLNWTNDPESAQILIDW
ncbi:MAG: FecR family protein [Litorimonas sp.]